ncbi:hypothetical protein FB45DRAFT_482997 [Roridomyces roridus]|uniref:F-box domain-containing protein n=1 Tax=Roridomyces roridus TaxID=1738132 RepID=A0AAD7FP59_9AGAR|nr:hypothetical protein FB45DRAFT_482997 [Roridomyces roridus]
MEATDPEPELIPIRNAPLLREALVATPAELELPWHQLTSLTLAWKSLAECLAILAYCPLLRHLDAGAGTWGTFETEPTLITLAHLESFTNSFSDNTLLQYLVLPRLVQLTLSSVSQPEHAAMLAAFMERSKCHLREFNIPTSLPTSESFRDILLALPDSIEHLQVTWGNTDTAERVFAALEEVEILPRLTHLVLRGSALFHSAYQALVDALRARAQSTAHLSVRLSARRYTTPWGDPALPSSAQMAQIRELVEEGMKMRLKISGTVDSLPVVFDWT